jgi:hypothetical protein
MFCSKCGTQQAPVTRICIKCNAPLPVTNNPELFTPTDRSGPSGQLKSGPSGQLRLNSQERNNWPIAGQSPQIPAIPLPPLPAPPQQNYQLQPLPKQEVKPPVLAEKPSPPSWNGDSIERPKYVYSSVEMTKDTGSYKPGQFLQPYMQGFQPNAYPPNQSIASPFAPPTNASKRAIWGLIFSVLSFAFCPIITAIVGVVLSHQELVAIERGLAPIAGKPIAQAGYYVGLANIFLYAICFALAFLLVFI